MFVSFYLPFRTSQVALIMKNLPANAGDTRDEGSIPGSGRSPGEGNGNPLPYSCLRNPMDKGARQTTAHGVAESDMAKQQQGSHKASRAYGFVKRRQLVQLNLTSLPTLSHFFP